MTQLELSVPEMHCGACEASIRKALATLPGVSEVTVNLVGKTVGLRLDPTQSSGEAVRAAIERAGFDVAG